MTEWLSAFYGTGKYGLSFYGKVFYGSAPALGSLTAKLENPGVEVSSDIPTFTATQETIIPIEAKGE